MGIFVIDIYRDLVYNGNMTIPTWHWSKQPNASEILKQIAKSKKGIHSSVDTEFKKGRTNQFKGKKLPEYMASAAAEGRRKSGMYNDLSHLAKHNFSKGNIPWNKDIPLSEETKKKMSMKLKGRKVWNTGNGIGTPLGYLIRRNDKYINWRNKVFNRDKYTCIWCKVKGKKVHADHIKPFALICRENNIKTLEDALLCKELWHIKNGRTLCLTCHRKTNTYAGKCQTELYKFPRKLRDKKSVI